MKANAPEKIWINQCDLPKLSGYIDRYSIEYVCTDAFIEKACAWLEKYATYIHPRKGKEECMVNLSQFRDYMKGE